LDTEWLLSTLFDASLLNTFEPPATAAPFFARISGISRVFFPRVLTIPEAAELPLERMC
jgi:hypothetical protein